MLGYRIDSRFTILKLRSLAYVVLVVLGVVWTGLLCVDAFVKGVFHSTRESVATIILLSSQVVMAIGIPIITLLGSSDSIKNSRWFNHAWFELLCLWLILSYQFTGALVFTLLSPSFVCHGDADEQGACQLVNAYISIGSWVVPIILLFYCIYATIRCFRLSAKYPRVWKTPFTMMPWNPNLLELAFESKQSTSTLSKPRSGSLDDVETAVSKMSSSDPSMRGSMQSQNGASRFSVSRPVRASTQWQNTSSRSSTSQPSIRASTQSQVPPSASKFSTSDRSVRGSAQLLSTPTPNVSRFSQNPLSARSNTQLQLQSQPRVQSYSQPLSAVNNPLSNLSPNLQNPRRSQGQNKGNFRESLLPPNPTLLKQDKRLTFQQLSSLPPSNPPPMVHATLGPPIPLTLRDKTVSPYIPAHHYYPKSSSTRQSIQFSTPSVAASVSRTFLPPSSLYPSPNIPGTPTKHRGLTFNKI